MARLRIPLLALLLSATLAPRAAAQAPDTVLIQSGGLTLHALLWRPPGPGPSPAVFFNHGSYATGDSLKTEATQAIGSVFARHRYVFLLLCRQGIGLSAGQGTADGNQMNRAFASQGQEGRNRIQLELLQGAEMDEAMAGLAFLKALPDVDPARVAIAGHSFGGSLTLLQAARDSTLRAVVAFSGSAYTWPLSPELRTALLQAVGQIKAPIFFIHAANDYSTIPGVKLSAELQRLGKPHRLKIYPAFGKTSGEGHNLVFLSVPTWEPDVFAFLDPLLRP